MKVCSTADIGHFVVMCNTTGTHHYPMAEVRAELDGISCQEKKAVSEELGDALLGLDVDIWPHMVKAMKKEELYKMKRLTEKKENKEMYAVSTKAQGEQQLD